MVITVMVPILVLLPYGLGWGRRTDNPASLGLIGLVLIGLASALFSFPLIPSIPLDSHTHL